MIFFSQVCVTKNQYFIFNTKLSFHLTSRETRHRTVLLFGGVLLLLLLWAHELRTVLYEVSVS